MNFGVLSDLFDGAGSKVLTANEFKKQHEFQGVKSFRAFLGEPNEKRQSDADFLWVTDDADQRIGPLRASCTWAPYRQNDPTRTTEYHLYYAKGSEPVVHQARPGDLLVIARKKDGSLLVLLSPATSTIGAQLLWLFGLDMLAGRPAARELRAGDSVSLGLAARAVLEDLGIEVDEPQPDAFDQLVGRFGLNFPGTAEFSAFARDSLPAIDAASAPDDALIAWMEHEEALFRRLEREIVSKRLRRGFVEEGQADVDGFLGFSLSVQNRRKSRAGYAFGHHVEAILQAHQISYTREATTEKRSAADFLFPGEDEYADRGYPDGQLAMLAVKTSCKDRWRQVLAEADRIKHKHLLTLEPAISTFQTAEMQGQGLQLVLPASLHSTYQADQRDWLMGVGEFLGLVRELPGRQRLLI